MKTPALTHLFVSPGHNFYGHHGGPPGSHPSIAVPEVECVAGQGIRGDRFFSFKPDYKGQITFFMQETLEDVWQTLRIPKENRDPAATRRNGITRGWDLNQWIGREFNLQGVRFLGIEECRPCAWMNQAIGPGAEALMRGRGGLRAQILSSGTLQVHPPPHLFGLVLAGGNSSRMGRDKATLEIDGELVGHRQCRVLEPLVESVAVAARVRPLWLRDSHIAVSDVPDVSGPMAGILAGLEWTIQQGGTHLLVLAVDMPFVSTPWLRDLWAQASPGIGVVPAHEAGTEPLLAVYPVAALPILQDLARTGDFKLQNAIARLKEANLLRERSSVPDDDRVFANWNAPDDM